MRAFGQRTVQEAGPRAIVGVISDTHGLLRASAVAVLRGAQHIVHGGDVGDRKVLEALRALAPVTAVRGNVDRGALARELPAAAAVEVAGVRLYVVHDLAELDMDPAAAGFAAVIYGHTHVPRIEWRRGVLYLNPGSAGPRRFRLPVTLARLSIGEGLPEAELLALDA